MTWEETLIGLLDAGTPITTALAAGQITRDNLWSNPALRDKLVALLTKEGTIESMLEASRKLREKHQQLLDQDTLTPKELRALGVLSGAAYALSADALARAVTPQAIFLYTIHRLVPWVQRVAGVVDLALNQGRSRDIDDPGAAQGGPPLDAARLRELVGHLRGVLVLLEAQLC